MRHVIARNVLRHGLPVFEPFTGGANLPHLWPPGSLCSDIDGGLIALYKRVQVEGVSWIPEVCSEEDYRESLSQKEERPIDTFRLVACSFGGKKRGGYARNTPGLTDYARQGRNALKRLRGLPVRFFRADFFDVRPFGGVVLFCDPPYAQTTGYKSGAFDSERFDARLRDWAKIVPVYVTEYRQAPGWVELEAKHNKPGATLAERHCRLFRARG